MDKYKDIESTEEETRRQKNPKGFLSRFKQLIRHSTKLGVEGVKILLAVIVAFSLAHMMLFIYIIYSAISVGLSWTHIGTLLLFILFAILFTFLACYLTYKYILKRTLAKIYEMTLPERIDISEYTVYRVEKLFQQSNTENISQEQIKNTIKWSKVVYRYYKATPVFIRSGITQCLDKIPVSSYILSLKEDITAGNQNLAAGKLRLYVDDYFMKNTIGKPSNIWTWIVWIVYIVLSLTLIQQTI